MKLVLWLLLGLSTTAYAMETDNYLSWKQELPDASEDLNLFIQSEIEKVLEKNSSKKNLSCKQVTMKIANRFKTDLRGEVFVNWSTKYLQEKIYPSTDQYNKESIYRKTPKVLLKFAPLAPNIQAGGVYFGVDKLSHFGSTGRRYFQRYLKRIKKGDSVEEAENAVIHFGLASEAGILGLWASGVFSYGDMEANYQGLRFYRKFCLDEQDTYLEQVEGRWQLVKIPDIRDYVGPYWDESFNLSYSEPRTLARTNNILLEEYCPMAANKNVLSRFEFYKTIAKKSRSMTFIEELQASGHKHAPMPSESQSFDQLCLR